MAVVIPIEVPKRKVGMNLAVQCNFNLPYNPAEFYKPPFWATRSLDKEVTGNSTSRTARSLGPSQESCRESMERDTNSLSDNDISSEEFYFLVQNYLRM